MQTWQTKNGVQIYRVLKGRVNSFLVASGNRFVLVDGGRTSRFGRLCDRLKSLGVDEYNMKAMILTHTHFDHAENAAHIQQKFHCKIIVQRSEAENLSRGAGPVPRGTRLFARILTGLLAEKLQPRVRYRPVNADIMVDEKLSLREWGFQGCLLHTPGHTTGSLSVIVDDEIALVGDALFGVFRRNVFPPFAENTRQMVDSWRKLLQTGCRNFLPAHGTAVSRGLLERQYWKYKKKFG